jgi:hypothetical protein
MAERSELLSIGDAARVTGIKVPTIRYYEQIGLVSAPGRATAAIMARTRSAVSRSSAMRVS